MKKALMQLIGLFVVVTVGVMGVLWLSENTRQPQAAEPVTLETALGSIAGVEVVEVNVVELTEMVVVTFEADQSETTNQWRMTQILCAARDYMPAGYGLRLAGDLANGMTITTATAAAEQIAGVECPGVIDWATWAAEYSG